MEVKNFTKLKTDKDGKMENRNSMNFGKKVQHMVAELRGWTDLYYVETIGLGRVKVLTGAMPGTKNRNSIPNWPTSLDTARGLEVISDLKFIICLDKIVRGSKYPTHDRWIDGDVIRIAFATAEQWCLAWILSEHDYRWVACKEHLEPCAYCNDKGGKWTKEKLDDT